jgi:hypothetical protein
LQLQRDKYEAHTTRSNDLTNIPLYNMTTFHPMITSHSAEESDDDDDSSVAGSPHLAELLEELDPLVSAALQEHWMAVATFHHDDDEYPEDVVVVDDSAQQVEERTGPAPKASHAVVRATRTVLEETMSRLRLSDSIALSGRESESQQRAEILKQSSSLDITSPEDAPRVLRTKGVVRLASVLSDESCDRVREVISAQLDHALAQGRDMVPGRSEGFGNFGTGFGFGSARMREQRWDMYLPYEGVCRDALNELLKGSSETTALPPLGSVFRSMLLNDNCDNGSEATLFDWSSFTSAPGSARQPVHPDNRYQEEPPLLTAFVALQDVTQDIGPTIFLPGTHTLKAHDQFNGDAEGKDQLLSGSLYQTALLKKGDAAVFDPRCLHCGGANTSESSRRVLLYMSFKNPRCTSDIQVPPGSMLAPIDGRLLSLQDFGVVTCA